MEKYNLYPASSTSLANELKKVMADYEEKQITSEELEDTIIALQNNCGPLFYKEQAIAPIIKKVIGQRRVRVIELILNKKTK